MTKIPIIDLAKDGAMYYVGFIFDNTRRQVIAYPRYEDILSAVKIAETQLDLKAIPLHELKDTDPHNTVYYTDSISSLCTSNRINEIQEKIQARGSKFTSKIHAEYHPDPEMMGKADHRCPYTIQNENYHGLMTQDFFILITTISKAAYIPRTLYAKNIHLALNEAYYTDDFITKPSRPIIRPEILNEMNVMSQVSGYSHVLDERLEFNWFKKVDDKKIQIPSTLEELLLNLLNLGLGEDGKIRIYSRDAYLSHNYLPEVQGFEYVDMPLNEYETVPSYKYFTKFKMSNTALTRMDFLDRLLFFKKLDRLVKFIASKRDGEIALLVNDELVAFFQILKTYQSGAAQRLIKSVASRIDDTKKLEFIKAINIGRKRKLNEDMPSEELIQKVMADYYVRYLREEPWTRINTTSSKTAIYSFEFSPRSIILLGTNYQFFQAIQLVSNGKELHYHSVKGGGITFEDKNTEGLVCKIYVKALKSLSNALSVGCVYVLDPMFSYWYKTYPQLFEQFQLENNNLEQESFVLKDFI